MFQLLQPVFNNNNQCQEEGCKKIGNIPQVMINKSIVYYCFNHSSLGCSIMGCDKYIDKTCYIVNGNTCIYKYCEMHYKKNILD